VPGASRKPAAALYTLVTGMVGAVAIGFTLRFLLNG
jgi:hypothetical protein